MIYLRLLRISLILREFFLFFCDVICGIVGGCLYFIWVKCNLYLSVGYMFNCFIIYIIVNLIYIFMFFLRILFIDVINICG